MTGAGAGGGVTVTLGGGGGGGGPGRGCGCGGGGSQTYRGLTLAEQCLGRGLLARGGGPVRADAFDFSFERGDARVEFIDRQRIERLADERAQHIVAAARKLVIVHGHAPEMTRDC